MTELYFPPQIRVSSSEWAIVDNAGRFQSSLGATTRVVARPGDRWSASLTLQNQNSGTLAAVQGFIAGMRGGVNSVWLQDHSYVQRGSFPSTELLTNNTFANGTTGWSVSAGTLTTADRTGRVTATQAGANPLIYQNIGLTQYAPHVLRSFIVDGSQSSGLAIGPAINDGVQAQIDNYSTVRGLRSAVMIALSASAVAQYPLVFPSSSGYTAGAFAEIPWSSLSRCALVDNGPNLLLRSQDFFTTWTQVGLTAPTANNTDVAPDGTTSAETMAENTANSGHYLAQSSVTVSSASADYALSCSFKASTGSFAFISMQENSGNHECYVSINLSTGALGTPTASGANWTNPRAFVVNQGNGWWRLTIVGRKTSAATALAAVLYMADSLTLTSYTGSSRQIAAWGASLAQSSVPVRYVATTSAAVAATVQSLSGPLYTKGWPVSTDGLLYKGDQIQIGDQLLVLNAPVNSDAAGLATIECYPARYEAPADNDPIIINQPMQKMMLASDSVGWSLRPGVFGDSTIEFVADLR